MSESQLQDFLAKVKADSSLQDKLKSSKSLDEVANIAKDAGFITSTDDLNKFQSELSADELESVGGGAHYCCGGSNTSQVEAGCSGY